MAELSPSSKILVLISGNGSNLQALIDAADTPKLPSTQIIRVISNRKDAYGRTRAKNAGIPDSYHNLVAYKKQQPATPEGIATARENYDQDLAKMIIDDQPDLVVCAGWMHILSSTFVDMLAGAGIGIINLHPAKPKEFNGAHAIERAYEAFQKGLIEETGIMMHYVISEVDMGEPILVKSIQISNDESLEQLEQRIHESEWGLIVEGTRIALEKIRNEKA
ncbi:putative phosphoribosylglycinamide formyltransferase [Phaeomoniella chlamydospora]|uniref:Phosphoribosylglycinamide formyltransferase n=1 Tax=Phaeomoniella chlamydospora TaxID=158046 RepID=A0A0G2F451_PHACM|nr:putative phosphoribosylglycinamide formyltransferase [Phaeomoniella chlamydospora]